MNDVRQMIGLTLLIGQDDGKTGAFSPSGRADRMTFLQDCTPTMAMVRASVIVRGVDGREPEREIGAYGGNAGIICLKHRVSVATTCHRLQDRQRHGASEAPSSIFGQSPNHVEVATGWTVSGRRTPHRCRCDRDLARGCHVAHEKAPGRSELIPVDELFTHPVDHPTAGRVDASQTVHDGAPRHFVTVLPCPQEKPVWHVYFWKVIEVRTQHLELAFANRDSRSRLIVSIVNHARLVFQRSRFSTIR